jgi:hypothetical protein
MRETRAVDLQARLPVNAAAEAVKVQHENPELLSRMLVYALTRRAFFVQLASSPSGEARLPRD